MELKLYSKLESHRRLDESLSSRLEQLEKNWPDGPTPEKDAKLEAPTPVGSKYTPPKASMKLPESILEDDPYHSSEEDHYDLEDFDSRLPEKMKPDLIPIPIELDHMYKACIPLDD